MYEARIRAINASGPSDWVTRSSGDASHADITFSTGNTKSLTAYDWDSTGGYTGEEKHINRLRVKYNLNSGDKTELYLKDDSSSPYRKLYTTYYTYVDKTTYNTNTPPDATNNLLITINSTNDDDDTENHILKALGEFKFWAKSDALTTAVDHYEYGNLYLNAIYDLKGAISIEGFTDIAKKDVTIEVYEVESDGTVGSTAITNSATEGSISGVIYSADNSTWAVGTTSDENSARLYTKIQGMTTDTNGNPVAATKLKITVKDTAAVYRSAKLYISNSIESDTDVLEETDVRTGDDSDEFVLEHKLDSFFGGTYILRVVLTGTNGQKYSASYIAIINK